MVLVMEQVDGVGYGAGRWCWLWSRSMVLVMEHGGAEN